MEHNIKDKEYHREWRKKNPEYYKKWYDVNKARIKDKLEGSTVSKFAWDESNELGY